MTRPLKASVFGFALLATVPLAAQQSPQEPPPAISTSANADVSVTPDRATIRISVMTKAVTAVAAAADNANKQTTVLFALRSLGIPNEHLGTEGYNVTPNYRYEQNRDPILTGYTVTNTIVADIRDLKMVGKAIDAALNAGANMISSLTMYASNTESARQQAIAKAVADARNQAEAAARGAGGTIGGLLDLNVSGGNVPPPRPYPVMAAARVMAAETPINAGDQTLTVTVNARWRFVQGR